FYGWVALDVGHRLFHTHRPQCHALVYLYIVADYGGFPDYNTGAMIDAEARTNRCFRVDVYTCFGMGIGRKHAREQGHAHAAELMRKTIYSYGKETWVGANHFVYVHSGRVTGLNSGGIVVELVLQLRQCLEISIRDV